MRALLVAAQLLVLLAVTQTAQAAEPPALAKARTLYNAANYEGAIDAAGSARRQPMWADAAALVGMAQGVVALVRALRLGAGW